MQDMCQKGHSLWGVRTMAEVPGMKATAVKGVWSVRLRLLGSRGEISRLLAYFAILPMICAEYFHVQPC